MKSMSSSLILMFAIALFAMFFGAGNFVLPPIIGMNAGESWFNAVLGFAASGIIAPFLGILAVVLAGKTFQDVGNRVSPVLTTILTTIVIFCIGPFIAIPRTGASFFEVGVLPIYNEADAVWTSILFYLLVFGLSLSPSKIVTIIGKYLTPVLILFIIILIGAGLFTNSNVSPRIDHIKLPVFEYAFYEGYQTMDALASIFFATLLISAARNKGYVSLAEKKHVVLKAAGLAMAILFVVYAGLIYLGASFGVISDEMTSSQLLLQISTEILGNNGVYVIAIIMFLACLTTSVALTASFAMYFMRLTNGRLGYHEGVILCIIISIMLSIASFEEIMNYGAGLLAFVYPLILMMVIFYLLFNKYVESNVPYLMAIFCTCIISVLSILPRYDITIFENIRKYLPLYKQGLEWIIPSLLIFLIANILIKKRSSYKSLKI